MKNEHLNLHWEAFHKLPKHSRLQYLTGSRSRVELLWGLLELTDYGTDETRMDEYITAELLAVIYDAVYFYLDETNCARLRNGNTDQRHSGATHPQAGAAPR